MAWGDLALQIWTGMFEAGLYFDLHRMPELFCGFPQAPGEGPPYTRRVHPQSWSAASVFLLFQAGSAWKSMAEAQVYFTRRTCNGLDELRMHNLEWGATSICSCPPRAGRGLNVLRRDGTSRSWW